MIWLLCMKEAEHMRRLPPGKCVRGHQPFHCEPAQAPALPITHSSDIEQVQIAWMACLIKSVSDGIHKQLWMACITDKS